MPFYIFIVGPNIKGFILLRINIQLKLINFCAEHAEKVNLDSQQAK